MAIMDEMAEQEIIKNKAIRGYIIRALAKGNQNTLLVRQVTNALVADGLIYSPDISKHNSVYTSPFSLQRLKQFCQLTLSADSIQHPLR